MKFPPSNRVWKCPKTSRFTGLDLFHWAIALFTGIVISPDPALVVNHVSVVKPDTIPVFKKPQIRVVSVSHQKTNATLVVEEILGWSGTCTVRASFLVSVAIFSVFGHSAVVSGTVGYDYIHVRPGVIQHELYTRDLRDLGNNQWRPTGGRRLLSAKSSWNSFRI